MNSPEQPQTPIANFTLHELIHLAGQNRKGIMRECVIAHTHSRMQTFRTPIRIDALIIGIGIEGEATVAVDLREYRFHKGSLFLFRPQSMIQLMDNDRFKAHFIIISIDLMKHINIDLKLMMPSLLQFSPCPYLDITEDESQALRNLITLIEHETGSTRSRFAREIICQLVAALLYKVGDILSLYQEEHPELAAPLQNRAEEYFRKFMALLNEHYKEQRSVGFYARELCITPKYLTTLIKRISQRSVSEWIDSYVVLEAKMLLKYSNLSIQEIAYNLNFPNQSFFGSYFKRNTGMSPSQYRNADVNIEGGGYAADTSQSQTKSPDEEV